MTARFALLLALAFAPLATADEPKKADAKGEKDKPLRAIVLLRTASLDLTEEGVTAALKKAYPKATVGDGEKDDVSVLVTKISAICELKKEKLTLLINSFPKPYVSDREALAKDVLKLTDDKELAAAAKGHEAWVSVDILGDDVTAKNEDAHYQVLSRVVAAFHDKQTTAVYFPEKNKLRAANAAAVKSLKAGRGLDLANDGVINIETDDADMKAAEEAARKSWKEFEKAFADGTGKRHAVKFNFTDKKGNEHMWVAVEKVDGETVVGRLANVPNFITSVKEGDRVKRPVGEVEDWLYLDGDKLVGGYTIKVLEARQKKRTEDKK